MNQSENTIINSSTVAVPRGSIWQPWALLAGGLIVTTLAAHYTKSVADVAVQREFDFVCNEIQTKIEDRLKDHEQILRSGAAFFERSGGGVSREEWRRFVERQKVDEELPGIQGIGFALLIPPQNLEQHVQEIRAQGFPQYQVRPEGEREVYTSIIYLEPFTNRNLRAFGYDMFSEVTRRVAMERARDQDCAALSGKVILVQETGKAVQAGTLMYVPVYRVGKPHETLVQRRDALVGWVYSPYRMNDLMQGVLGNWNLTGEKHKPIHLEVFDGESISSESLLYDSQPGCVDKGNESRTLFQTRLVPSSRPWTLRFTSPNRLSSMTDYGKVWLVLFGGTSTSLSLCGLFFSVLNTRFKALQMASKLTTELARSEQSYRNQFASNSAVMLLLDPTDGAIIDANAAAIGFYGYPREQLLAMLITDIDPKPLADVLQILKYLRADLGQRFQFQHRLASGELRDVEASMSSIEFGGRSLLHSIVFDVTERKRAEELLFQTSERLALATRAGAVGIWDYDVLNNKLDWDEQMFRLYGIKRDQFGSAYEAWLAGVHPDDRQRGDQEIQLALRGEKTFDTEFRVIWPDGSTHYIRALATVRRDASGQATQMIGTNWDITAQKRAEKKLIDLNQSLEQETARAESANAAKSDFLANMSHEIRTPLNGVLGMVGLLQDTHLTGHQRHYAQTASASGEALLSLINDILDYSSIEAGKLELETLNFALHSFLDDFAGMMALRAHQKGLALGCVVAPEVPSALQGDPGRLRQILINLTGNAIKFTAHGEVVIRVSVISETPSDVRLRFAVQDTGIGIPADKIGQLFEKFSQIDTSTTRAYGGTGLGLAISKQLTELMGGEIGIQSEVGKGSEFWFTALLAKQPMREPAATPELADLGGVRVLIVDNHPVNREVYMALLTSWGVYSSEAADGPSALRALTQAQMVRQPFTLAILGMQMPGMDGKSLGRAIRNCPGIENTRLVMSASIGQMGNDQELKETGFSATLPQPVRRQELFDVLAAVIRGKEVVPTQMKSTPSISFGKSFSHVRILLAEDNITNQQVAVGILKKLRLKVDVAANGVEAVKALATLPYDLVLMDVQMPEMDGLEATRAIRDPQSRVLNPQVTIVAMTAHALQRDREKCLQAGMNDYLTKPIERPALVAVLKKWLKSNGEEDDAVASEPQERVAISND